MPSHNNSANALPVMVAWAVVFLVLFPHTASSQTETDLSGDPTKGRDHFVQKGCIRCHGVWSEGRQIGPDLVQIAMGRSMFQLGAAMWNHAPEMSGVMTQRNLQRADFTGPELRDLITYLYYLNYFNQPGDPTLGQRIFSEKGCMNCHSVKNVGGQVGPRLDTYGKYGNPLYMNQAMWNHGSEMTAEIKRKQLSQPRFEQEEMSHLLAFIRGRPVAGVPFSKRDALGDPISGRRLFAERSCSRCHTVDGSGSRLGPDLGVKARQLSVAGMAGSMWNHRQEMWNKMEQLGIPFPRFTENEMTDLIGYLYFVSFSGNAGDRSNGRVAFDRKGCSACHGSENRQESGAPDLGRSPATASSFDLLAALWNHSTEMVEKMEARGLAWPEFNETEMSDLAAYLFSTRRGLPAPH